MLSLKDQKSTISSPRLLINSARFVKPNKTPQPRLANFEDLPTEILLLIAGHLGTECLIALAAAAVPYGRLNHILVQKFLMGQHIINLESLPRYAIQALKHSCGAKDLASIVCRFTRNSGPSLVEQTQDIVALMQNMEHLHQLQIVLHSEEAGRYKCSALAEWKGTIFSMLNAIPGTNQCRVVVDGPPSGWSYRERKCYRGALSHPSYLDIWLHKVFKSRTARLAAPSAHSVGIKEFTINSPALFEEGIIPSTIEVFQMSAATLTSLEIQEDAFHQANSDRVAWFLTTIMMPNLLQLKIVAAQLEMGFPEPDEHLVALLSRHPSIQQLHLQGAPPFRRTRTSQRISSLFLAANRPPLPNLTSLAANPSYISWILQHQGNLLNPKLRQVTLITENDKGWPWSGVPSKDPQRRVPHRIYETLLLLKRRWSSLEFAFQWGKKKYMWTRHPRIPPPMADPPAPELIVPFLTGTRTLRVDCTLACEGEGISFGLRNVPAFLDWVAMLPHVDQVEVKGEAELRYTYHYRGGPIIQMTASALLSLLRERCPRIRTVKINDDVATVLSV